ncbi:MAG TPA: lysylphosphatidylglycerol synthase transmembrane domain-containing protein [Labilithrix sp.]|nr:lysylphosphatidylglycerol synthase transmembrane domain-containing protein [Labilithrix sp.]
MKPSTSRTKTRLVFFAKAAFAVLLIVWLVRSGHLDMGALRILIERPWLLAMNLGLFTIGACVTTLRFSVLLGLADVHVPLRSLFRLQMTAYFFNVVIPGNIGGDVVKALYVARDEPKEKRTTILLVAFVERLLGVAALVLLATFITLARPAIWSDPLLRPLATAVVAIGGATLIGGTLALVIVRKAGAKLDQFTSGPSKLSKLLNQLVASMRLLSAGPRRLVTALGLSMFSHALAMAFFTALTRALLQKDVPYTAVATVFPLGLLTLMIPISPSGLGVGHVAFKRLFEAIGLAGGATVFNVYLLGQITPCLLGIFPFLSLKRRGELPSEVPPDTATAEPSTRGG